MLVRLTGPWRRQRVLDLVIASACFGVLQVTAPGLLQDGNPNPVVVGLAAFGLASSLLVAVLVAAAMVLPAGPRLLALVKAQSRQLRRATSWALGLDMLLLISAVVDVCTDTANLPEVLLRCTLVVATVSALLAMARLAWFFSSIRRLSEVDSAAAQASELS